MKSPLLSIIISCYNDPDIGKAIESASNQTIEKEIIVIDDGSNQSTKKLIQESAEKIDILVTQQNSGQSIARNNGIKKAKGKFILNLDSDDFFEPGFSKKAIENFQADSDIKIVTCKARRFNKYGEIDVFNPKGGPLENFLFHNSALGSAMFRKTSWEEVGGYEEKLPILGFEDWEFYLNLLKTGGYAYVIDEVLFNYQVRPDSTTKRIQKLKQQKFKHIIRKHRELYLDNFDELIDHLFSRIENASSKEFRWKKSLDYRIGNISLQPFRRIKRLFRDLGQA